MSAGWQRSDRNNGSSHAAKGNIEQQGNHTQNGSSSCHQYRACTRYGSFYNCRIGDDPIVALYIDFIQQHNDVLMIIPSKPNQPAIGKNPKSKPVSSIPTATPIRERGSIHRMIPGSRKFPNKATKSLSALKCQWENLASACKPSF